MRYQFIAPKSSSQPGALAQMPFNMSYTAPCAFPKDILWILFEIYANEECGSLKNLMLVCKDWYQVADMISELWSAFNVMADDKENSEGALGHVICRTPEAVDTILKRSKSRPVKLRLVVGMRNSRSSCSPEERAALFRYTIGRCASRISYLAIDILLELQVQEAEIIESLRGVFIKPMPAMKQIRIIPFDVEPDAFGELYEQICQTSPLLSHVSLPEKVFQELITYNFLQDSYPLPLESIEVHASNNQHFGISLLAPIGRTMRSLFVYDKLIIDIPGNVIHFPHLKTFEVDFISMEALSVLSLPTLEEFVIVRGILGAQIPPRSSIHLPAVRRMHVQNVVSDIACIHAPSLQRLSLHTELWSSRFVSPIFRHIFDGSETSLRPSHLVLKFRSGSFIGHILPSLGNLVQLETLEVKSELPQHAFNLAFWRALAVERESTPVLFPKLLKLLVCECLDVSQTKLAKKMLMSRRKSSSCTPLLLMALGC
jgi:hypothetical protein